MRAAAVAVGAALLLTGCSITSIPNAQYQGDAIDPDGDCIQVVKILRKNVEKPQGVYCRAGVAR